MQTILGGGGAIGTSLAKELKHYTSTIRIVSRNPQKVNDTDELHPANLLNAEEVMDAVKGSEIVYLTVGLPYSTKIWQQQWPVVMRNVIAACKKHNASLVFFDNMYMYDSKHMANMTEDTPVNPSSKKGKVRAQIAQMLLAEIANGTVTALIARAADFYGPNIGNSLISESVVNKFRLGKSATWLGSADKVHSFTYTPDAARATALLGNTLEAYNQVWHLPTHQTLLTGKDWITLLAKEMNITPKYQVIPVWMLSILGVFIPIIREFRDIAYQYTQDYRFNSAKFDRQFKFVTTSPETAVKEIARALD